MRNCPNCGNHWDTEDAENHEAAAEGRRSPILLVEFIAQEMDLSYMRLHCTSCSTEYTATYKDKKHHSTERVQKNIKYKPPEAE